MTVRKQAHSRRSFFLQLAPQNRVLLFLFPTQYPSQLHIRSPQSLKWFSDHSFTTVSLSKNATPSTCPVCGKKSNPLTLSILYLHSPFPLTNTPTSLACVCTLQLTYTTLFGPKRI